MFELIPFDRRGRMTSFDPFRELEAMERSFWGSQRPMMSGFRTDVIDAGDSYKLECELPGFNKEDIRVDVEDGRLSISAERKSDKREEDEKKNYLKRERFYGSFSRSFDLTGIDEDKIEAAYADGVLTLTLPKQQQTVAAARRLEIQ